ncbi:ArsR/SmtB family transcription factor [Microbacterium halophytorum]|uniref:ArsR/SmtB family transcription factor n=1 Tax=Microbacterium halophytorum TaxID=2067568 RepID=UPI000CFD74B2|nr:metalloregulator ArsR/SmtB family transcription factor [Microbacterium halophytorum]
MKQATDPLSRVFQALGDPTRRGILERLSSGEATVGELAEPFEISAPAISQHLRVLEGAGLIERSTRAQWRVCSIHPEAFDEATAWIETNRALWQSQFDRLDDVLAGLRPPHEGPPTPSTAPRHEE